MLEKEVVNLYYVITVCCLISVNKEPEYGK